MGRRATESLTARQVQTSKRLGYTADGMQPGLNLQVAEGVAGLVRSWVFRYTSPTTKTRREMGLGSAETRSLSDAREQAAQLRLAVLNGIDPKDQRDRERRDRQLEREKQVTFKEAAARAIATREHEWKNEKHRRQWTSSLETYAFPVIGSMPVADITTEDIYRVLEPIWTKKTETATRVRQRIESVLDWCKARKLVAGDNPAGLKGGLGQLLPKARNLAKVKHHPAVPYVQVHAFVQALRKKRGIGPKALEFLLLTAARSGEVLEARWDEIDLQTKVWTIPAQRMKAGKEHRVPLCARAVGLLKEMLAAKTCEFVFPNPSGKKSMSSAALLAVMKGMPGYAQYVPHGLRSTFRDWAGELTSFPNETLELALAHTIENQAEAAYRRGDQLEKRVELMRHWEAYIETAPRAATVTALRGSLGNFRGVTTGAAS